MTSDESQIRPNRTLGREHDEFWMWCARGEFRLQRCDRCQKFQWPVAPVCEHCGGSALVFEPLSGRGAVVSWATFERDYYQGTLPIPWDTILVELEEGPLFISNPCGFGWQDISPNMPVEVAFIEVADAMGRFTLPVFERSNASSST